MPDILEREYGGIHDETVSRKTTDTRLRCRVHDVQQDRRRCRCGQWREAGSHESELRGNGQVENSVAWCDTALEANPGRADRHGHRCPHRTRYRVRLDPKPRHDRQLGRPEVHWQAPPGKRGGKPRTRSSDPVEAPSFEGSQGQPWVSRSWPVRVMPQWVPRTPRRAQQPLVRCRGKRREGRTISRAAVAAWRKAVATDNFAKLAALPTMRAGLTLPAPESVRGVTCETELDNGPTVRGAMHTLKNGGTMTALALIDEDRMTVTYEVATKSGTIRRLTKVHQVTGELTSQLMAEADDGVATDISALRASNDDGLTPMANGCPDCMSPRCDDMDWGCAAACCGACRFANFFVMMGCLAVFCPGCTVRTCCRRYSCQPIARCGPY